ncbi:MAG: hypothetical protein DRP56_09145 [Planctomycetota bacterium]|nr:MAG: hypothetical protein DRP56_09145 [Planctomycetota bacterium]
MISIVDATGMMGGYGVPFPGPERSFCIVWRRSVLALPLVCPSFPAGLPVVYLSLMRLMVLPGWFDRAGWSFKVPAIYYRCR